MLYQLSYISYPSLQAELYRSLPFLWCHVCLLVVVLSMTSPFMEYLKTCPQKTVVFQGRLSADLFVVCLSIKRFDCKMYVYASYVTNMANSARCLLFSRRRETNPVVCFVPTSVSCWIFSRLSFSRIYICKEERSFIFFVRKKNPVTGSSVVHWSFGIFIYKVVCNLCGYLLTHHHFCKYFHFCDGDFLCVCTFVIVWLAQRSTCLIPFVLIWPNLNVSFSFISVCALIWEDFIASKSNFCCYINWFYLNFVAENIHMCVCPEKKMTMHDTLFLFITCMWMYMFFMEMREGLEWFLWLFCVILVSSSCML